METITKTKPSETEQLFSDLDKPSLHALSYALRHPDTWPEGFYWDYDICKQCAMGLAHLLWDTKVCASMPRPKTGASIMAKAFAMPFADAKSIFLGDGSWCPKKVKTKVSGHLWWRKEERVNETDFSKVTPEMVADQIDTYLKRAE